MPVAVRHERVFLSPAFSISFQRVELKPAAGEEESPCNLGALPVCLVADFFDRVPRTWTENDAVFVPVLPDEAMWLGFAATSDRPHAVQIELGEINAVSGTHCAALRAEPQNYLVCPPHLHWDGVRRGNSLQVFAADILLSDTVLRIVAFDPVMDRNLAISAAAKTDLQPLHELARTGQHVASLELRDPYGLETWDLNSGKGVFVYFVDPVQYEKVTGKAPPMPRRRDEVYNRYRLP